MSLSPSAAYNRAFTPVPALDGKTDAATVVGQAWLGALTATPATRTRLARARSYPRAARITELSLSLAMHDPHHAARSATIRCVLADDDEAPPWDRHRWGETHVTVSIPCLRLSQWQELTHIARALPLRWAQLTGAKITERLLAEAERHAVALLPAPQDLRTGCSCTGRSGLCKHAATALFQTARLLDTDPLSLLLLRGRAASDFLAGVADPDHPSLTRAFRPGSSAELPQVSAIVLIAIDIFVIWALCAGTTRTSWRD
ncbi:hypothetical protein [Kitasatospora sp. NPDC050543]|uniref:hypothetical protein n=1 Tax=Kitasatospora sp. NPDC050543 TaxID=3364054 RepID=UPI003793B12E